LLVWLGDGFDYTARLGRAKYFGLLDNGWCLLIVSELEEQQRNLSPTTAEDLRGLAVFAVGLPAVFLVAPVFLVVFAAGFSAFLALAFLVEGVLAVVFSYEHQRYSIKAGGRS